ncbi:tol-pal system-associated acyl-CoA thioesterase [Betaproteobacteria bacterium]|nr:tol-pal system-associated acyl-CoA thioesterase [Betaproteobacteria bacterium]GHT94864.1 tol-pal system-associated acyl-CoA thioesterase [Betaproteobacteria bacterium]GHU03873.1 tol-pal system-associated acyl-CoA thioesterase [Betaproteobacteria bacterium]GHU19949.1 tol-pal system-associated acyl-CoA thioesterase [Betaproteobacteria bacterium]
MSPPSPPTAAPAAVPSFAFRVRAYYEDTDAGGVVYYASYLRFLERARTEWLRTFGVDQRRLNAEGGPLFVVRSVQIDYLSPARLDDELTVITSIKTLGGASVSFLQRVERAGTLLVSAEVRIVAVSIQSGRATPIPKALHEQFQACLPH